MELMSCNIEPMYFKKSKNIDNLYLLPSRLKNREIMYSPLRGIAFMVDSNTASNLMIRVTQSAFASFTQLHI